MSRERESAASLSYPTLAEDAGLLRSFCKICFAFAARHNPMSILGLLILALLIMMALWPELFTSQSATLPKLRN